MSFKKILPLILLVVSLNCFGCYKPSSQCSDSEIGGREPSRDSSQSSVDTDELVKRAETILGKRSYSDTEASPRKREKLTQEPYIDAFFSKSDDVSEKLRDYISKETSRIRLAVYWFYDWSLAKALAEAKESGTTVQVIIDQSSATHTGESSNTRGNRIFNYLKRRINDVYLYNSPAINRGKNTYEHPLMHDKFMLLDSCLFLENEAPTNLLVNGSFNFTKAANEANEDNIMVTNNTKVFNKYAAKFEELKTKIETNNYK